MLFTVYSHVVYSLFNTVEVPAMHNPPITTMQVILVHNLGGPFRYWLKLQGSNLM